MTKFFTLLALVFSSISVMAQPFPRIPNPFPRIPMATAMAIVSPLNGTDLRLLTAINLNLQIAQLRESDAKIVVFRSSNNAWPRVQEIPLPQSSTGAVVKDVTPALHFCEDVYAIRVMSGTRTLAGPVHFQAGTGACESSDKSKFVNLESNQVDLLNFTPADQSDRDTCGAFATSAALSAAYRRLKGHNVLLSQNYMHHIIKSSWYVPTPMFLYENQTSFGGGNSVPDAMKAISSYPVPKVEYNTYKTQLELNTLHDNLGLNLTSWNEDPRLNPTTQADIDAFEYSTSHIPLIARQMAVYGVTSYKVHTGAEGKDTDLIENYLKVGQEVILGLKLKWKASTFKAKTMNYDANVKGGAHMMVIVGFDKTDSAHPYFLIKNSWGDGVLRVHYDVIRNQTNSSIAVIDSVREPTSAHASRWVGSWEMKHDQWRGQLLLRRVVESNIGRLSGYLRLGEYHHSNGKRHCVYGTFDPTSSKLMMKINFDQTIEDKEYTITYNPDKPAVKATAKSVCSEVASGQDFELNMATNTHKSAYGTTIWNNITFPAEIWR